MEKYLTIEQAAEYLSVSVDTIKRYVEKGELPTYKLDRALRFKTDDLEKLVTRGFEVLLTRGLRAAVRHVVPVAEGAESWRVILEFLDTRNENRKVIPFGKHTTIGAYYSEYHVFVTGEFLEDIAKLPPTSEGAEKYALRYIKERFEETADKKGDRDITRIEEMRVACYDGKCHRGEGL